MASEKQSYSVIEAENKQTEIYRKMSGEKKLRISLELYNFARAIIRASIIESHPGIAESALEAEINKRFAQ
jgi:hypothetical protein